jgi:hypothetical protein
MLYEDWNLLLMPQSQLRKEHQDRIGGASPDPRTLAPTDTVREKAAETTDSEEPAVILMI